MNNRHSIHFGFRGYVGTKTDQTLYYKAFLYLFINNEHILLCQSIMHITKHRKLDAKSDALSMNRVLKNIV